METTERVGRKKRSSILKAVDRTDDIARIAQQGAGLRRRVSFHNVRTVQQFDAEKCELRLDVQEEPLHLTNNSDGIKSDNAMSTSFVSGGPTFMPASDENTTMQVTTLLSASVRPQAVSTPIRPGSDKRAASSKSRINTTNAILANIENGPTSAAQSRPSLLEMSSMSMMQDDMFFNNTNDIFGAAAAFVTNPAFDTLAGDSTAHTTTHFTGREPQQEQMQANNETDVLMEALCGDLKLDMVPPPSANVTAATPSRTFVQNKTHVIVERCVEQLVKYQGRTDACGPSSSTLEQQFDESLIFTPPAASATPASEEIDEEFVTPTVPRPNRTKSSTAMETNHQLESHHSTRLLFANIGEGGCAHGAAIASTQHQTELASMVAICTLEQSQRADSTHQLSDKHFDTHAAFGGASVLATSRCSRTYIVGGEDEEEGERESSSTTARHTETTTQPHGEKEGARVNVQEEGEKGEVMMEAINDEELSRWSIGFRGESPTRLNAETTEKIQKLAEKISSAQKSRIIEAANASASPSASSSLEASWRSVGHTNEQMLDDLELTDTNPLELSPTQKQSFHASQLHRPSRANSIVAMDEAGDVEPSLLQSGGGPDGSMTEAPPQGMSQLYPADVSLMPPMVSLKNASANFTLTWRATPAGRTPFAQEPTFHSSYFKDATPLTSRSQQLGSSHYQQQEQEASSIVVSQTPSAPASEKSGAVNASASNRRNRSATTKLNLSLSEALLESEESLREGDDDDTQVWVGERNLLEQRRSRRALIYSLIDARKQRQELETELMKALDERMVNLRGQKEALRARLTNIPRLISARHSLAERLNL